MTTRSLKEWRDKRGISLRELAERSGVHFTSISEIEHGNRRPHAQTASRIARALGINMFQVEEFFDRSREAIPNEEALGLLASPPSLPRERDDSEAQDLHQDMLGLIRSMAAYLVRVGRGGDVERILRAVLEETEGGRR